MTDAHPIDPRATWDRMAPIYVRELDRRFAPIVELVIAAAALAPGEVVIDLGTGTGSVALAAARCVGPAGRVLGVDISPAMLALADERARESGVANVAFQAGSAHDIPAEDASADVLASSLCLMFVPDRAAAARECARVLRPGGRFVASVWGPPERCDIVRLQAMVAQAAGGTAPAPEVSPGSLADPMPFLRQLRDAGIEADASREVTSFRHESLQQAFQTLSTVARVKMKPEQEHRVKAEIAETMWPDPEAPRLFTNEVVLIAGRRR